MLKKSHDNVQDNKHMKKEYSNSVLNSTELHKKYLPCNVNHSQIFAFTCSLPERGENEKDHKELTKIFISFLQHTKS